MKLKNLFEEGSKGDAAIFKGKRNVIKSQVILLHSSCLLMGTLAFGLGLVFL